MSGVDTAEWYRQFAETEARGSSPTYERLALTISQDEEVLALLDTLPQRQRQPNTLFAVVRLLNGPIQEPTAFRVFVVAQWPTVSAELRTRGTQTNEPGRCLDINPLNVSDPTDLAWLDALVWPEHTERRERLHRAAVIVAADPPQLVRGDLEEALPSLIAQAPVEATLVVFHSSVLYQVPPDRRAAFVDFMRGLDRGHWVAVEGPDVLPHADLPPPPDPTFLNVLSLDEVPLAWTRGHGQGLAWFGPDVAMGCWLSRR